MKPDSFYDQESLRFFLIKSGEIVGKKIVLQWKITCGYSKAYCPILIMEIIDN